MLPRRKESAGKRRGVILARIGFANKIGFVVEFLLKAA